MEVNCLGGFTEGNVDDPYNIAMAKNFVQIYNNENNGSGIFVLINLIRVQKQIVAGMMYRFTVQMGLTGCLEQQSDLNCFVEKFSICYLQCFYQPWTNTSVITNSSCGPQKFAWSVSNLDLNMTKVVTSLGFYFLGCSRNDAIVLKLKKMTNLLMNIADESLFKVSYEVNILCPKCKSEKRKVDVYMNVSCQNVNFMFCKSNSEKLTDCEYDTNL